MLTTVSCICTVIQNYFKISNASYTPSVIPYEFIYNLRIVVSGTLHVLLENRAWRILSGPPGNILRLLLLMRAQQRHDDTNPKIFVLPNAAKEVFILKIFLNEEKRATPTWLASVDTDGAEESGKNGRIDRRWWRPQCWLKAPINSSIITEFFRSSDVYRR